MAANTAKTETTRTQQFVWFCGNILERTVRRITTWEGRTVGVIKHNGGEYIAVFDASKIGMDPARGHWDALVSISQADVYGSK
jgi:hypothetical protein